MNAARKPKDTDQAEKRGRGRPPAADPRIKMSIRIKESLADKFRSLGTEWLEAAVRRARDPDAS